LVTICAEGTTDICSTDYDTDHPDDPTLPDIYTAACPHAAAARDVCALLSPLGPIGIQKPKPAFKWVPAAERDAVCTCAFGFDVMA